MMKKLFLLSLALLASFSLCWGQTLIEIDDMETTSGTGDNFAVSGWKKGDCGSVSQSNEARTGSHSLKTDYKGTNDKTAKTTNTSISVPQNSYLHCIGYAKMESDDATAEGSGNQAASNSYVGGNGKGTYVNLKADEWTKFTSAKRASSAQNSCYVLLQRKHGAQKAVLFDDVVIYVSTNSTTDVTAPSAATSASITASAISWTCGSDANTGIQNTLIWHRTSGSANDLTLNNQGKYVVPAEGSTLDQSGHWTLVSASVAANATSYSGTFTEDETYAIVHRDLAYNYSTPTYVTLASACAAKRPGEITKGTASGGTGIITLTAGGNIADGDTWYWQTAEDGTATDLGSGATKNVNAAGTYYVRSYNTDGDCWSIARSITVSAEDLLTAISPSLTYASEVLAGNTLSPTLTGNDGSGAVSYALNDVTPAGSLTINTTTGVVTAVTVGGTATVTATIAANGNYKGNTATSGTITVVAPSHDITYTNLKGADNSANPTTYYEGTGVASFTKLRHVVGYDFTSWSPSSISTSETTDQTIEAQWTAKAVAEGTGTLTYAFAYSDNTITTSSVTRNNGALYDANDLTWTGVEIDASESNERSGKITTTKDYDENKYLSFTFKIADGYTFTPTEVKLKAVAVSDDKTIRFEFKDNAAGTPNHKYLEQTRTNGSSVGELTYDFDASDPVTLTGTVTVKIYAYGATNSWRLGTPITITGTVAAIPTYAVTISAPVSGGTLVVKNGDDEITSGDAFVEGKTLNIVATPTSDDYKPGVIKVIKTGVEPEEEVTNDVLSGTTLTVPAYAVTVSATFAEKAAAGLAWSAASASAEIGKSNSFPTLTNENGLAVTYSSSVTSVASFADNTAYSLTLSTAGTTTISATFEGDGDYKAQTVSYTLTVTGEATALDNTAADAKAVKRIENGQLFIEKDGKTYNVLGTVVK